MLCWFSVNWKILCLSFIVMSKYVCVCVFDGLLLNEEIATLGCVVKGVIFMLNITVKDVHLWIDLNFPKQSQKFSP